MFAVNGPSGPTSRYERRVREHDPVLTQEQREEAQRRRQNFFVPRSSDATANTTVEKSDACHTAQTLIRLPVANKENAAPPIFQGCRLYFNGRTGNVTSYYLTKLVQDHGGNLAREFKVTRVTHIVACNLSGSKTDKLLKSCGKIKCVRPEWILESVKQGKKLPEYDFFVYKDASAKILAAASTPTGP